MAQPSSGEWKHGLCECACPDCACVLLGCGNCYAGYNYMLYEDSIVIIIIHF